MTGIAAIIAQAKLTRKALKRPKHEVFLAVQVPRWVVDIHARAENKKFPFNRRQPSKRNDWYFDGERYRHRDEKARETKQHDRTQRNRALRTQEADHISEVRIPIQWDGERLWFELLRPIGRGGDGVVYLYILRRSGHKVAVKIVDVDLIRGQCRTPVEVVALREYLRNERHPNIVRLHDCLFTRTSKAFIVMEWCSGGSLEDLFRRRDAHRMPIPDAFILHFIASMAEALEFLHGGLRYTDGGREVQRAHTQPIIHRDIMLANILLRPNPNSAHGMPDIVLADFGAAQLVDDTMEPGTPDIVEANKTSDPVLKKQSVQTTASDVYALGVCISRLLSCGKNLCSSGAAEAHAASVLDGTAFPYDHLSRCTSVRAQDRPSVETLFLAAGDIRAQLATMTGVGA